MPSETVKQSVGIIGMGVLGRAIKNYYKNALVFDINPEIDSNDFNLVAQRDWVFVCVPTPSTADGKIDLSAIEETIERLSKTAIYEKTKIVIKSTVVPGTAQRLQDQYPHLQIISCPEFLTENTACEDFAYPDKNIIGTTRQYPRLGADLARILPVAPVLIMTSTEAEMVKYAINSYYAMKVIFANELYDLCEALDANYNAVHRGLVADKRINDSHFSIFHGTHRGFGGKCLTKDTMAIVEKGKELGIDMGLLKQVLELNKKFIKITF